MNAFAVCSLVALLLASMHVLLARRRLIASRVDRAAAQLCMAMAAAICAIAFLGLAVFA